MGTEPHCGSIKCIFCPYLLFSDFPGQSEDLNQRPSQRAGFLNIPFSCQKLSLNVQATELIVKCVRLGACIYKLYQMFCSVHDNSVRVWGQFFLANAFLRQAYILQNTEHRVQWFCKSIQAKYHLATHQVSYSHAKSIFIIHSATRKLAMQPQWKSW